MILESNREHVLRRLVECLGRDRTKHQVAEVTSLGLVQMTRKRVGQGLIEAFSTTCESCGGRGIHIQTDPVKARASMPFDEIMKPQEAIEREDDSLGTHVFPEEISPEVEQTELSAPETEPDLGEDYVPAEEVTNPIVISPEPTPGRRRRRAASTGVITPGA